MKKVIRLWKAPLPGSGRTGRFHGLKIHNSDDTGKYDSTSQEGISLK
jgi:hypothetical protein